MKCQNTFHQHLYYNYQKKMYINNGVEKIKYIHADELGDAFEASILYTEVHRVLTWTQRYQRSRRFCWGGSVCKDCELCMRWAGGFSWATRGNRRSPEMSSPFCGLQHHSELSCLTSHGFLHTQSFPSGECAALTAKAGRERPVCQRTQRCYMLEIKGRRYPEAVVEGPLLRGGRHSEEARRRTFSEIAWFPALWQLAASCKDGFPAAFGQRLPFQAWILVHGDSVLKVGRKCVACCLNSGERSNMFLSCSFSWWGLPWMTHSGSLSQSFAFVMIQGKTGSVIFAVYRSFLCMNLLKPVLPCWPPLLRSVQNLYIQVALVIPDMK